MSDIKIAFKSIKEYKISLLNLLKYLIYILSMLVFQIIYKVDFVKYKIYKNDSLHNSYEMTDIFSLNKILKDMKINSEDSILDIGCGKGVALYKFSKYFHNIYGIEFDKEIYDICCENMDKLKISANIANYDINNYIIPDNINYIFMFNPFSGETMKNTISRIKTGTILIYHNPLCENMLCENNFVKLKEYNDILGISINVYKKL